MLRQPHKDNKGFTIIEVLIVLAIAGLIMLIVFLAVPALRRNSNNTEIRNEASRVLTAANEWVTNSNGAMPSSTAHATQIRDSAGTSRITNVTIGTTTTNVAVGSARIAAPGVCNNNVVASGTGRQLAIQFGLESGGGTPTQACISM